MKRIFLFVCLAQILLASTLIFPPAANADADMEKGIALFRKRRYSEALNYFVLSVRKNPQDSAALYYEALTYQNIKEFDLAKRYYKNIIQHFPGSEAAQNSLVALSYLDPQFYNAAVKGKHRPSVRTISTPTPAVSADEQPSADWASLPAQARIHYKKEGQNLLVSTSVNGRPIEMFFDSGAEGVVLRKSEMLSLGIKPPEGAHSIMSYGVGDAGGQKTWIAKVTLKLGTIERKNFPVHVQEDPPGEGVSHPLLGQEFFKDFMVSYDHAPDGTTGTILLQKKNPGQEFAANDSAVIPFKNMGKDILVPVTVKGKKIPMIFDTGAESCVFSVAQLQALGISIPENAVEGIDTGIAGNTKSFRFTLDRMELGPIIKTDVPISAIESNGIPYPLLGNSFLHDLRIDVDNASHKMRVRR